VNCLIVSLTINFLLIWNIEQQAALKNWDSILLGFYISIIYIYVANKSNNSFLKELGQIQANHRHLLWQKHLIENILPSEILVLTTDLQKVLLRNKALGSLFDINDDMSLLGSILSLQFSKIKLNSPSAEDFSIGLHPSRLDALIDELHYDRDQFLHYKSEFEGSKLDNIYKREKRTMEVKMGIFEDLFEQKEVLIMIFRDVSQSEQILELIEFDQKKNQIMASVSHDLRTPINSIIGILNLVLEMLDSSQVKIRKYVNLSIDTASSLLFLVNDLLDTSQITNGKLNSLNFETINVQSLINPVLQMLKFPAKKKGVLLTCDYGLYKKTEVSVDRYRFQQILVNLIGNALKFTDSGGLVKIEVLDYNTFPSGDFKSKIATGFNSSSLSKDPYFNSFSPIATNFIPDFQDSILFTEINDQPSNYLTIKVTDSGMGIKPEDIGSLFTAFGKFDNNCRNQRGVGLGLFISQKLAQMMTPEFNGSGIKVQSTLGKGSSFWFPIKLAEEKSVNHQDLSESDQSPSPSPSYKMQ
jgi:signal transduction histidine kinase